MAAKKKVTVELEVETLKKLLGAAEALSELANGVATGSDDPSVRALLKKGAKKRTK